MKRLSTGFTVFAILICLCPHAQTANRFDVVITEIMADPTPAVGLPEAEYIEIKNISRIPLPLKGWQLADAGSTATLATSFVLLPDSLVILCAPSHVAALSPFGRTVGVAAFPSLNNSGDVVILRSPENKTIHAVAYAADWYGDENKTAGGWSLEIIDPATPCLGKQNWKASVHPQGGTPGQPNSVNAANPDETPPRLKKAYVPDSTSLVLVFDEPLDSTGAAAPSAYTVPGNTVIAAVPMAPLFQTVRLTLASPLPAGAVSTVTVSSVTDCRGNAIGAFNQVKIGQAQPPLSRDVVINEILFNPKPGGYDYVEFYNRSNKVVDAAQLFIATRNSTGAIHSPKRLTSEPAFLFPGEYLVVTENKPALMLNYLVRVGDAVLPLPALPSLPDDKGTVVLQAGNGDVIDEVNYSADWHFPLIDNPEGVALERVDPDGATQAKTNWHSAASTAGYGTPTYQNSQYKMPGHTNGQVQVTPPFFSPDNDGHDDLATIHYEVEERGFVANVFIFDAGGRMVRHLVKNALLGTKGEWNWDGLGENKAKLPIGTYIVFTELFNPDGRKKSFKNTVVLARRWN